MWFSCPGIWSSPFLGGDPHAVYRETPTYVVRETPNYVGKKNTQWSFGLIARDTDTDTQNSEDVEHIDTHAF